MTKYGNKISKVQAEITKIKAVQIVKQNEGSDVKILEGQAI